MTVAWRARHGLTSAQYQAEFNNAVGQGYRLTDVSGYSSNGEARYAALWEKSTGPSWAARHGLTSAQYQSEFNSLASQGYRLVHVSGYTVNGEPRFAAIWDKSTGASWVARHGMTSAQYQEEFNRLVGQGFRLKDVSGYSVNGQDYYAAIWDKSTGPAWAARHGMTSAQYQTEFNTLGGQGYRLVHVSGYDVNGDARFAAIWEKSSGPAWIARHGMTSDQYQAEFDALRLQGYRPTWVSGYATSAGTRYAAIWINDAFSSTHLRLIDDKIKAYVAQHGIPGLSIAVAKDERLVFAKGYGFADTTTREAVKPKHLFRIASISKPVTAVAVMELVETGVIRLDQKVFGDGAILGTQYGTKPYAADVKEITVEHLLQHTSGWTTNGGDPMFTYPPISHAELITKVLDTRPLEFVPGKEYNYWNFGYCVLGRIIEKKTGRTYEDYVRNVILTQCGVTQMFIGGATLAERRPNEVVYYGGNPYQLSPRQMDANGGWIATPVDLLRFMVRTDGFTRKTDVLLSLTEQQMFTGSADNPGYGAGWIVDSGYRGHNGAMSGTVGFLVSRTDGLSFAILANTRPSTDDGAWAAKDMLNEIVQAVTWPAYDLFG